jgi:membrane-associated protein
MLGVLGGALIVAFGVWTIRRRHGGGAIEPAPPRVRNKAG